MLVVLALTAVVVWGPLPGTLVAIAAWAAKGPAALVALIVVAVNRLEGDRMRPPVIVVALV